MKIRFLLVIVLLGAAAGSSAGQTQMDQVQQMQQWQQQEQQRKMRQEAAQHELDREELMNLQKETAHAIQLHNGSFIRRVYSDDFVGVEPSGQVVDKTGFASLVETSTVRYTSIIPTDVRLRVYETTAVVTSLWTIRAMKEGVVIYRQSRVMIVYVTSPRGWVAVSSQETQLPG